MTTYSLVRNDDNAIFQQYFNFTATQGSTSAFVQATIATGLTPDLGVVAVVDSIFFEFTAALTISAAGTSPDLDCTVTRASKAAIPLLSDADVIGKYRFNSLAITTTGLTNPTFECPVQLFVPGKQLIVGPNVYVQFDSTAFSNAITATGRINYHTEKMSKNAILEILYG